MREDLEEMASSREMQLYKNYWKAKKEKTLPYFDSEDFLSIIGLCLMERDFEKAEQVIFDAKLQHPTDIDIRFSEAELLAEKDSLDQALAIISEIDRTNPENIERYVLRAMFYLAQDRYTEAEVLFRQYEEIGGEKAFMACGMAQCLAHKKKYKQAYEYLYIYLSYNIDSIESCNRFVSYSIEWDLIETAIEGIRKLVQQKPYNKFLWKSLYELYETLEDYESAYQCNEYTLAIDPMDFEAHGRRILCSDYSTVEAVNFSFKRFRPEKWNAEQRLYFYYHLSEYYADRHYYENEIACLKKLLEISSPMVNPHRLEYRIATIYHNNYNYRLALDYYERARDGLRAERDREMLSLVHYGIGLCNYDADRIAEALSNIKKAWLLDKRNADIFCDYVAKLLECNLLDDARRDIVEAIEENNHRGEYYLCMAALLYFEKKAKQAVECFVKAFELNPSCVRIAKSRFKDIIADGFIQDALQEYLIGE